MLRKAPEVLFDHHRGVKHYVLTRKMGLDIQYPNLLYPEVLCKADIVTKPNNVWCMKPTLCARNRKHQGLPWCAICETGGI